MSLEAVGDLEGTEATDFWNKWGLIKNKIAEILSLPQKFLDIKNVYAQLHSRAMKVSGPLASQISRNVAKVDRYQQESIGVSNKIRSWLPTWIQAENVYQGEEHPLSRTYSTTLGVAPVIVIGAVGMAVLGYVTIRGLRLIKEYNIEKQVLEDVRHGVIKAEEAAKIISPGTTIFGLNTSKMVLYGGILIITIYFLPSVVKRLRG